MTYHQIIIHLTKVNYIRNTCNIAGELAEDLFQHTWLKILELPKEKIEQIFNNGYIRFYIYRMIISEIHNPNNPFLKVMTFKTEPLQDNLVAEEYNHEQDKTFEQTTSQVKSKINNLFWYDKKIFELYIEHGSLRKVEKQTGIKYGAINQTVTKVRRVLRGEK